MTEIKISSGRAYPLGATFDGKGVNFALFSANAEKVELCLFNRNGTKEEKRFAISTNDNNIWHIYLEGIKPEQVYGYRVYGPYKPQEGKRFNPNKLLLDPYAKKLIGKLIWHKALFGYDTDSPQKDLSFSTLDSAPYVPKSVVTQDTFDWEDDKYPQIPFEDTVIYETHVRGYTMLHPKVPPQIRGKFAGMAADCITDYLDWLGVTAVELLPVFAFFGEKGGMYIDNYWGYETLSYFIPEAKYMNGNDIDEFKRMVKILHAHNKEVILDVVYNHTIEGNQMGPTLCYRGIDNESYYTLQAENKRFYYDTTGCGASFNLQNPYVLTLVMDSLRYWHNVMHVDGFRLDLATSLSRVRGKFTQDSGFLLSVRQDESMRSCKIIAEPWDATMDGYQIGAYPPGWAEWNDRYRDVVRRLWRGDEKQIGEFASRISGSSDIFGYANRDMWSSINFVTSHDGFNLTDLVSYNEKHNMSNGENNCDGNDANWSWNSGTEGKSADKEIIYNRLLRKKAMLATLLMSFGTPMLVSGDEFGNTQFGNNNPYCQDNVLTWIVWEAIDEDDKNISQYVKYLIELRRKMNIFKRIKFFDGRIVEKYARYKIKDMMWLKSDGNEFESTDWYVENRRSISCFVYHEKCSYMMICNANEFSRQWRLPSFCKNMQVKVVLDSADEISGSIIKTDKEFMVPAWSVVVLEIVKPE
ncbi:MAG: glycogen debranching protein GlgX [Alphaproteobacteria bacterium]|nr:glycogen debranching protein GlgX [Alphaproteobacteria bacterium]